MNDHNNITYFISSVNRISGDAWNCEIELGPVGENFDNFYCKCIGFNMNANTLQAGHPINYILVAENLSENGYKTYQAGTNNLENNEMPIAWLNTDNANSIMQSGEGSQFVIKNLRQKRRIRFTFRDENLTIEDGTYFNGSHITEWSCILLLHPF
jgi:hypothetical protein